MTGITHHNDVPQIITVSSDSVPSHLQSIFHQILLLLQPSTPINTPWWGFNFSIFPMLAPVHHNAPPPGSVNVVADWW